MRLQAALSLLALCGLYGRRAEALEWPKDLSSAFAANRTGIHEIEALVAEALDNGAPIRVADFRFVPLEKSQRVDLIAIVGFSGRGMFNSFVALWQSSDGYGHAVLLSDVQGAIGRDVVDMDGNGIHEVIAGNFPGGYQGAGTLPIPSYGVYELRDGKWENVTDRYPGFYPDRSPSLVLRVLDACEAGDRRLMEIYRDNDLFVTFKSERIVLHNRTAGLEAALGWAGSTVPPIQVLAIKTLCDISDPRATAALKKMSEAPDAGVRIQAGAALAHPGACSP